MTDIDATHGSNWHKPRWEVTVAIKYDGTEAGMEAVLAALAADDATSDYEVVDT